jgi:predicted component of type VI protein secretion system
MNATLLVVAGNTTKRKVALRLPCVLGRSREADVTVVHPLVSRRHCELSETGGLLMLRDLASLNGTMIGGRRIASAPLPPDGEFTIGPLTFRLKYQYNGDPATLPPICFADEAGAEVEFAKVAPDPDARPETPAGVPNRSESEIVEFHDFAAWADADPDEVAPPARAESGLSDRPPPQTGGTRESPWASED